MPVNENAPADLPAQLDSESEEDEDETEGPAREGHSERPPSTLLDLIATQQNHGEPGVRLAFHDELASQLSMECTPYFYCGLHGLPGLAAYLYSRGLPCDRVLTAASFSSRGTNNGSPWQKSVTVSASETAMLASHPRTANVLQHIELGVPLHWARACHSAYPNSFKRKMQLMMDALCSSSYFVALPGAVRVAVVDQVLSEAARAHFWSDISSSSGVWGEPRGVNLAHAEAWDAADKLCSEGVAGNATREEEMPVYNFRLGIARRPQLRRFVRLVYGVTTGSAAVHLSRALGCARFLPNAGIFLAAFVSPTPAWVAMICIKSHQMHKKAAIRS